MKGYTTKTEIENYLLITIDSSFDTQVDNWIEAIEAYIDRVTGRNFIADEVSSETDRYYDGDNTSKLLIDDCVEITEIENGKDNILTPDSKIILADGNFVTYPANRLPITRIELRGGYFSKYPKKSIRVRGRWGFSEDVPADIKQVATILVAGIINFSLNSDGEVKSMSIGRYNVTYKDKTEWADFERCDAILASYKKFTF